MYYDAVKDKLYLPAGCYIEKYFCTGYNGQDVEMSLTDSFVAERKEHIFNHSSIVQNFLSSISSQYGITDNPDLTYLFPTNSICLDNSPPGILQELALGIVKEENSTLGMLLSFLGFDTQQDYTYKELLNYLFYADYNLNYNVVINFDNNFNDLLFGNGKVVSYENTKYDTNNLLVSIYKYFRKTAIYSPDVTCIGSYKYHERHISNSEDTSYLIPDGVDTSFLNSSFFKDNYNNTSGYFIYNDTSETIRTESVINYSNDTSYVSQPYSETYINNYINNYGGDTIENIDNSVIDNSVVDNSVTNYNYYYFENTDSDKWLSKIYTEVYQIRVRLDELKLNIDNTTNNFEYNTKNYLKFIFVPSKTDLQTINDDLSDSASEHLGILYQPWEFLIYTFGLYSNINEYDEIQLTINEIDYEDTVLLPETVVNFTNLINSNETYTKIYNLYLDAVDFVILILLGQLAYRVIEKKRGDK